MWAAHQIGFRDAISTAPNTHSSSADTCVSPEHMNRLLLKLLADAALAMECDVEKAKGFIARASALLHSRDGAHEKRYAKLSDEIASQGCRMARWQVRRIETFVDANLGHRISIGELASVAGLSAGYFSRVFKREFGVTPHDYVLRRRIQYAQDLMLTTAEPLCQIALACGLSDQAHLSRLFRREIGVSPSQWRRQSGALQISSEFNKSAATEIPILD